MPDSSAVTIAPAHWPQDAETVRELFREYIESLGVDLSFQSVEAELSGLPGKYAPPLGEVLLARDEAGNALGCVAVRPLPDTEESVGICEMKRLYVRPAARGRNLGRRLAMEIIASAKSASYRRMVLDTMASLIAARRLYESLGFVEIAPYYHNPMPDILYFSIDL